MKKCVNILCRVSREVKALDYNSANLVSNPTNTVE